VLVLNRVQLENPKMASAQDRFCAAISILEDSNHPISLRFRGWFDERHRHLEGGNVGRRKSSLPRGVRSKEWERRNDAAVKRRKK
jgi:hypothetical protein